MTIHHYLLRRHDRFGTVVEEVVPVKRGAAKVGEPYFYAGKTWWVVKRMRGGK